MKAAPKPERCKFDETFKREAVQYWLSSSKSGGTIAEEPDIHPNRLDRWRKGLLK
jgi:transposase-like protein